jgi:hypothetical protein
MKTLIFATNNIVMYHEHWYLSRTTLTFAVEFAVNNIDTCPEHAYAYNT